jgi:hypothetical protein
LTTQATIGIRGTHYQVQICAVDQCINRGAPAQPGMYGGVYEGRLIVANPLPAQMMRDHAGDDVPIEVGFGRQQVFAEMLREPAAGDIGEGGQDPQVPAFEFPLAVGILPFTFSATEDLATADLITTAGRTVVVGSDRYTLELDSTTNPSLQLGIGSGAFSNGRLVAGVGTASIVDVGSDTAASGGISVGTGLNWGRWQGAGSTIAQTLGGEVVHNDGGNLHYVYGNIATSIPASGQVSYAPIGGTRPTDSSTGAVGTLISGGSINIDFTTAQLALTGLAVGFANATYTMEGTTRILNGQFSTAPVGAHAGCVGTGCQSLVGGNLPASSPVRRRRGRRSRLLLNTRIGSVIEGVTAYRKCSSPESVERARSLEHDLIAPTTLRDNRRARSRRRECGSRACGRSRRSTAWRRGGRRVSASSENPSRC